MIISDCYANKADETTSISFDEDFFQKYQDRQVIGYLNPNHFLPTPVIMLYAKGRSVVMRWPTGFEQCFDQNEHALKFLKDRYKNKDAELVIEKNIIILEEAQDVLSEVSEEFKYLASKDVQLAWCDPKGQVQVGTHQALISSYNSFLADDTLTYVSRDVIVKLLAAESDMDK